jgi:hypothetical protein
MSIEGDFEKEVMARFKLVGGNIRYILSESRNTAYIETEIATAVAQLSPEDLRDLRDLDIGGTVPSLCYTIKPTDVKGVYGI